MPDLLPAPGSRPVHRVAALGDQPLDALRLQGLVPDHRRVVVVRRRHRLDRRADRLEDFEQQSAALGVRPQAHVAQLRVLQDVPHRVRRGQLLGQRAGARDRRGGTRLHGAEVEPASAPDDELAVENRPRRQAHPGECDVHPHGRDDPARPGLQDRRLRLPQQYAPMPVVLQTPSCLTSQSATPLWHRPGSPAHAQDPAPTPRRQLLLTLNRRNMSGRNCRRRSWAASRRFSSSWPKRNTSYSLSLRSRSAATISAYLAVSGVRPWSRV